MLSFLKKGWGISRSRLMFFRKKKGNYSATKAQRPKEEINIIE